MSMAMNFCQSVSSSWPCKVAPFLRRRLFHEIPTFTRCNYLSDMVIADDKHLRHQANTEGRSGSDTIDLWSFLSAFLDTNNGVPNAGQESILGLSTPLFNDENSFVMEKETPAEYVPAPPIDPAEMELNKHLEDALYMLRDLLPGPMSKVGMEHELAEGWRRISDDVKVQDPLVCMKGKDRLQAWLYALKATNAELELHDVYAERLRGAWPFRGYVYAVWTLLFIQEPHLTGTLGRMSLSGESKFEIDSTGKIVSVESQWYVIKEGKGMLDSVKMYLSSLLLKEEEIC